jgi:adenylate cyclase
VEIVKTEKFSEEKLVLPLEEFMSAGARAGVSYILLDIDNVVRRFSWHALDMPSLEVAALEMVGISPKKDERKMVSFTGPAYHIPCFSYYKALDPDRYLPAGFLSGKIVLVGKHSVPSMESIRDPMKSRLYLQPPSSVRGVDMFATPFYVIDNRLTPGIEIHANMLASLMRDDCIKPLKTSEALLFLAMLSFILTLINRKWTPLKSVSLNTGAILLFLIGSFFAYSRHAIFLPFGAPLVCFLIDFASSGVMSYIGVESKRRFLKKAFSLYVSPGIAEKVIKHPDKLRLGGQRVSATVLFTDLAGFTDMSEKMEPEEVVAILNRYTTKMTKIIFKYQGTLDKFIGDSVMAFWGAPVQDEHQAEHACQAALEMQRTMHFFSTIPDALAWKLSMRVGINTGTMMAGNMGSDDRFDFTVIGDHVNIASRLEGLNKVYGTRIIISEFTHKEVGQKFATKRLDSVRVKGKARPIVIYELLDEDRTPHMDVFEEGLDLYQAGQFKEARERFSTAVKLHPGDHVSHLFIQRCDSLLASPPEYWDGVWALQ